MNATDKLPKWAQEHIRDLQRQRDEAIRALNEWVDGQTPSPFRIDEYVCTGEATEHKGPVSKTRFVQTHKMTVTHGGVELHIMLRGEGDNGKERICLQWDVPGRSCGDISMKPVSFQSIELLSKENM